MKLMTTMRSTRGKGMLGTVLVAVATGLMLLSPLGVQGADLLHNSNDTGSYNAKWPNGWGIAGGKYGEFTCATCHEPNNKANLKNIRRQIYSENGDLWPNGQTSVSVTFRNQTGMGDDTQAHAGSNRICEVCHSKNRFHNFDSANNSAMGHPNPKEVCVTCHKHNTGFKAACGGCHGNPPTTADLGGNTGLIGTPRPSFALMSGQAGAHDKHVNGRSLVCDTCHYISNAGYKMPTQSGTIQIGFFGFGGKVTSGTYVPFTSAKRGYPFASGTPNTTIAGAVTDPNLANKCANVYCHGGGAPGRAPLSGGANQTPKWDGTAQSACGSCHGASAANPPTMGSHQKHAGSTNGYSLVCDTCHPSTDISHVQGNVRWHFSDTDPRVAGATYQAAGSGSAVNAGTTGAMAPSAAYGQCSNLYCHTNGRGGAANVATPTWGDTTGFTGCVGCHGGAATSAAPITSNAHKAHTNNTTAPFNGIRFSCAECHSQVVNATNTTIIGNALHVNSSKNVDWGTINSGSASYGTNGCSQIYCHSNGRGSFTPPASTWTAVADGTQGTASCDYCHRGLVSDQKPMSSARHLNHITQSPAGGVRHKGVTCDVCHDNTVAAGGNSLIAGGSHLNKGVNVNFAKFANRSGSFNAGSKQCSNTYCHASTTMTWTSATINQCGDCHAANNRTTQGLSSPHIKHYNTATMPTNANGWTNANNSSTTTASNVFMCGTCHAVNPETDHINGPATPDGDAAQVVLSLPFTPPTGAARPNTVALGAGQNADGKGYFYSAGTTCDTYCHSDARGGLPKTTMRWSTTTSSCGNCHNKAGDANPTWSAPHTKHVNTYNGNTNITCNSCHAVTASGNNALLARRDRHPNGFRNVTSNTAAGPFSWDGDRCSNSYCHYGTSPSWSTGSGTLPADCTGCHGNDASSGKPMTKNAHKAHVNNQSARFNGFNFRCNECHNSTVAADNRTIASYTVHANGLKTVVWGTLSNGGGAYNAGACATIYCHSNGQATPTYKAPANWTTVADGTEGTANCDYCHGGQATDTTPISSNRHANHITTSPAAGIRHKGVTCDTCHDLTAAPGGTSILASGGNHLNRKIDINFAKFSNRSGSYTSGTRTCSVTYCHGRNNPVWTTTTVNNCSSCHYATNTANGLSGPHAKHYNSATRPTTTNGWNNTNSSTKTNHVFYCGVCHAVNPEADHVNGPVTQNGASAQIVFNIPKVPAGITRPNTFVYGTTQNQDGAGYFYSTGTTCDVYCHSDGRGGPSKTQFNWTSTVFACGECHNSTNDGDANPTWSTPHTRHIRGYAEGGNTNFGCYACHKSTVNSTSTTIADKSKHINGYRNISSSTFSNFVWNGTTCSTGYCHSDGKAAPNYVSQSWTSLPSGCNSCHGGAGATNPNGQALSAAHAKHLNSATYGFKCASCHAKTADPASNAALKNYTGVKYHVNGTRNVILSATYGGTWTSPSCSTVYCHSNGQTTPTYNSPNWTSTTSNCTTCHGGDAGQASIMASNRHGSHMNNATNLGTNFACATCHASTMVNGSNTAIADYSRHLNKSRDVSFGQYSGTAGGTSPAITCSNTRCHANRNPAWNAAATTDHKCTKCHGAVGVTNPTPAQMAPGNGRDLDGSNTMTSPTKDIQVGAHQQHLAGVGSMNIATVRCIECHTVPATATANNHLGRRAAEVTFANASSARKNGATPAWTPSNGSVAGSCSNVYCHGAAMPKGDTSGTYRMAGATTVFWNQTSLLSRTPSPATCGVCHGAPPTAGTTAGTHASYVGQGLGVCNQCHNHVNTDGTIADVSKHINGTVDALTGCNACHDYDVVGATFSGGKWTGGSWGKSSKDGLTPNEGWGAHAKHINYIKNRLGISVALNPTSQTFGVGEPASICGSCHTNNVANHTTSGSTVRTINFGDSAFKIGGSTGTSFQFGGTNPLYNGASGTSSAATQKTCSNISCHYFTTPIWSTY